jgi:hypothetical protein
MAGLGVRMGWSSPVTSYDWPRRRPDNAKRHSRQKRATAPRPLRRTAKYVEFLQHPFTFCMCAVVVVRTNCCVANAVDDQEHTMLDERVQQNETTVPLLPCVTPEDTVAFWRALGFAVTYEQKKPYLYLAFHVTGVWIRAKRAGSRFRSRAASLAGRSRRNGAVVAWTSSSRRTRLARSERAAKRRTWSAVGWTTPRPTNRRTRPGIPGGTRRCGTTGPMCGPRYTRSTSTTRWTA